MEQGKERSQYRGSVAGSTGVTWSSIHLGLIHPETLEDSLNMSPVSDGQDIFCLSSDPPSAPSLNFHRPINRLLGPRVLWAPSVAESRAERMRSDDWRVLAGREGQTGPYRQGSSSPKLTCQSEGPGREPEVFTQMPPPPLVETKRVGKKKKCYVKSQNTVPLLPRLILTAILGGR